jgi:excisionase family DNA binding protein
MLNYLHRIILRFHRRVCYRLFVTPKWRDKQHSHRKNEHRMILNVENLCVEFEQQYTVKQVAEKMNCSSDHVVALHNDGELDGIDIARKHAQRRELRFSEADLDKFAERRKTTTAPAFVPRKAKPKANSLGTDSDDYGSWFDKKGCAR